MSGLVDESSWWEYAECRNSDPKVFQYPVAAQGAALRRGHRFTSARALCAVCPVRRKCLDDALVQHPPHVGGFEMYQAGFTPPELDELLKERRRRGQAEGY